MGDERGVVRALCTHLNAGEVAVCGGDPDVFGVGHDRDRRLCDGYLAQMDKLLQKEILAGAVLDLTEGGGSTVQDADRSIDMASVVVLSGRDIE